MSPYVYANDNPMSFKDPTGLAPEKEKKSGGKILSLEGEYEREQYELTVGICGSPMTFMQTRKAAEEASRFDNYGWWTNGLTTEQAAQWLNQKAVSAMNRPSANSWRTGSFSFASDDYGGNGQSRSTPTSYAQQMYNNAPQYIKENFSAFYCFADGGQHYFRDLKTGTTKQFDKVGNFKDENGVEWTDYGENEPPDMDGVITFSEATDWYRNGNGLPLSADLSKIDMSCVPMDYIPVNESRAVNLILQGCLTSGQVYGTITLTHIGNGFVVATLGVDRYNFNTNPNASSVSEHIREFLNYLGKVEAEGGIGDKAKYRGKTKPYSIYFYNIGRIGGN